MPKQIYINEKLTKPENPIEYCCYNKKCEGWTTKKSESHISIQFKNKILLLCGNCKVSKEIINQFKELQ